MKKDVRQVEESLYFRIQSSSSFTHPETSHEP